MKLRVLVRPEVAQEMGEIRDWYETQRQGLGDDFAAALKDRYQLIGERPELFAVIGRDVRATTLSRFPYNIYYVVGPEYIDIIDTWRLRT